MLQYNGTVLFVKDMPASRRFYEELLAQKVKMESEGYVVYESSLCLWSGDLARLSIYQRPSQTGNALGSDCFEVFFDCDDPDEQWQRMNTAGVKPIHPVLEMPWGQRVLRVYDPEGYRVEIGAPVPVFIGRFLRQGLSIEETARRTFTPVEIVRQIAAQQ